MRITKGEKIFNYVNIFLLVLLCAIWLYPFLVVLSSSISSADAVKAGRVMLLPIELTLDAYVQVFQMKGLWMAYANTIFLTVVGTLVSLVLSICAAYPLSKKQFRGRTILTLLIALTMWFQPGIIPTYLNIRNLGLLDTRTSLIIGFACSAFYIILLRTFFQSIPGTLEEAAKIEGANELQILKDIYLPLSTPGLITIGLYYAIQRWNGFFWASVLLNDQSKIPLQVLLKKLIVDMDVALEQINSVDIVNYSQETVIFATIIVSIIPIVMIYPFIQKFFIKGIMVGSIKG